jgi:uroporphyrinogen decarboxylase
MTSRENIITTLSHKEPDKISIDLGGMDSTGIHGIAYNRFKKYLGINKGSTKIFDPYQQVAKVEIEVLEKIKGDVIPIIIEPKRWKKSILKDGSDCEIPEKWNEVVKSNGEKVAVDSNGNEIAVMPVEGYYFEPINPPYATATSISDIENNLGPIKNFDWPSFADETYKDLENKARYLYDNTNYALMGNFCAHIFAGGQLLRGFEQFMEDLIINPAIAECIMENLTNSFIERFKKYNSAIGKYVQIINVNDDLGTQEALQISPKMYRKMIKPYHKRLYQFIKKNWNGYLFLHSDGNIYEIIPDLIEIGVDIINPVQYTAKDMDCKRLKKEFGDRLSFWGGGCDTQKVLPFGTCSQVKEEVKKQIDILAPGGGFVFCQVHNIQYDIKPENIMAMYEAVNGY